MARNYAKKKKTHKAAMVTIFVVVAFFCGTLSISNRNKQKELDKDRKEIERLEKEKEKLESEIKRVVGKLSNESFVSKAPDHIVDEERAKQTKYQEMLKNLIDRLNDIREKNRRI